MRRVRILVLAVILIAIVCAGISLYAYQHNKRAEENTIDIIKDFTGKEEVDVSGQSRKPIDSMTLYDGGVLQRRSLREKIRLIFWQNTKKRKLKRFKC